MLWTKEIQIRSSDLDRHGHVSAAASLGFFDEARAVWLAQTETEETAFVLAEQRVEYLKELLLLDENVRITIDVCGVGASSFETREALLAGEAEQRVRSEAKLLAWDPINRRSRSLTAHEQGVLAQLARTR